MRTSIKKVNKARGRYDCARTQPTLTECHSFTSVPLIVEEVELDQPA